MEMKEVPVVTVKGIAERLQKASCALSMVQEELLAMHEGWSPRSTPFQLAAITELADESVLYCWDGMLSLIGESKVS